MGDSSKKLLDKVAPGRRLFVQRVLGTAGFSVPLVRSFVMASAAAAIAPDIYAIGNTTTPQGSAPEIDPSSAAAALALLASATVIVRGRVRSQDESVKPESDSEKQS